MPVTISPAAAMGLAAAACFGGALVLARVGLGQVAAGVGTRVSISATALAFWALAPWLAPSGPWSPAAVAIFAGVGVFFPAWVTRLTYAANARMGPGVTGALGATTPVYAVLGAMVWLGEWPGVRSGTGLMCVVLGVAVLSLGPRGLPRMWPLAALWLPLGAAALRGLAQPAIKDGLALEASPFLAGWVGYTVSTAMVWSIGSLAAGDSGGEGTLPRYGPRWSRRGLLWFVAAGLTNGAAVLLTYGALRAGSVAIVAPLVATTPLFALGFSAALLRAEPLHRRQVLGVMLIVAGAVLLVLRGA